MSDDQNLTDKLYRTKYEADPHHSHITIDGARCKACADKACVTVCPAAVYRADEKDPHQIHVSHENCLECGSCRAACTHDAIDWRYPEGGKGVKYRFG